MLIEETKKTKRHKRGRDIQIIIIQRGGGEGWGDRKKIKDWLKDGGKHDIIMKCSIM